MGEDNYSLGQRVFRKIREDILAGNYKKDEELKEKNIGDTLGVSRTPVREALRQLELEGLVSIIPNKGAYVVGFTVEDIRDIYEIRTVLEGLCARRAALYATEAQLEELEEILYLTEFYLKKRHLDQMVELDTRFHEVLYGACASKMLEHSLRDYHRYLERVRKTVLSMEHRALETKEEHLRILEAVKAKDERQADACATKHIINTIHNMDSYGWEALVCGPSQDSK